MNSNFKKLALASAVAVAGVGFTTTVGASSTDNSINNENSGDAAIIPYYNVAGGYVTGVHIINTSDRTTPVKVRLRQRSDSEDVLDFNVVMSPKDVWTGIIKARESDGAVTMTSSDTTCTVPLMTSSGLSAGLVADEGYVEIFAMAQPVANADTARVSTYTAGEMAPVAIAAKHVAGVPRDCEFVKDNFVRNKSSVAPSTSGNGVWTSALTGAVGMLGAQTVTSFQTTTWGDAAEDTLKVSWFIREQDAGWEVGGSAQHIQNFIDDPSMSNQSSAIGGLETYADPLGFDFPNINGGSMTLTTVGATGTSDSAFAAGADAGDQERNSLTKLTVGGADNLSRTSASNDWVYKVGDGTEITADWVVAFPGQLNLCRDANDIGYTAATGKYTGGVTVSIAAYDREEGVYTVVPDDDIVVSPAPPGAVAPTAKLTEEVNLIRFSDDAEPVGAFGDVSAKVVPANGFENGWAMVSMTGNASKKVCDYTPYAAPTLGTESIRLDSNANLARDADNDLTQTNMAWNKSAALGTTEVVTLGYAAWKKVRADEPGANYGRAVEHTWTNAS